MTNIATLLRSEIARVARREARAEIESLKKASAGHRAAIADLRRQLADLQQQVKSSARLASAMAQKGRTTFTASSTKHRFSPNRLAAHRAKLGLSAASYGQLVGMSGGTIYLWEQGKVRPNQDQIGRLAEIKSLGKRDLALKLSETD